MRKIHPIAICSLLMLTPAWAQLPTFNRLVTASNGLGYVYQTVGRCDPTVQACTTTIDSPVIPVQINITQGGIPYTFDPTFPDTGCLGTNDAYGWFLKSPIYFTSGLYPWENTPVQWGEAYLRANDWNNGGAGQNPAYRTKLVSQDFLTNNWPELVVSVTANGAGNQVISLQGPQCGNNNYGSPYQYYNLHAKLGQVDISTLDAAVQNYISVHGFGSTTMPMFLTYNAAYSELGALCCAGYHAVTGNGVSYGVCIFSGWNYTALEDADISACTHEVGEIFKDPFANNYINNTPPWSQYAFQQCQTDLEVGDPLDGNSTSLSLFQGFSYHVQDLAFDTWFFGLPGKGPNGFGIQSMFSTLHQVSTACPNGGGGGQDRTNQTMHRTIHRTALSPAAR